MTRRELIAELENSFHKYPTLPDDAEVVYKYTTDDVIYIQYVKSTFKNSQPLVMLI